MILLYKYTSKLYFLCIFISAFKQSEVLIINVEREDCMKWKSYDEVNLKQDMGNFIKAQRNRGPH